MLFPKLFSRMKDQTFIVFFFSGIRLGPCKLNGLSVLKAALQEFLSFVPLPNTVHQAAMSIVIQLTILLYSVN